MNPQFVEITLFIFILGMAVIVHECAHGWVALLCGDPTAKMLGRLTLNPIKHIDPIGTILVPVVTKMTLGFPFGWAKPVPVNFAALRHPKRDMMLVAFAGPLSNILIAVLATLALPLAPKFLGLMIIVNLFLAIFNLVPIPPLDGSRIVTGLLPNSLARQYLFLEPFGFIILLVLLQINALDFLGKFVLNCAGFLFSIRGAF